MEYPAKILLFGEYGILLGSMGLAMPFPRYSGLFRFLNETGKGPSMSAGESNAVLTKLLSFFEMNPSKFHYLRLKTLKKDILNGLYFDSTIPQGSGLGSSGALTAALYARYSADHQPTDYQKVRSRLSAMEDSFHGMSSGLDPVISLLNKPVLIDQNFSGIGLVKLDSFLNSYTLFLINSGTSGSTNDLVAGIMRQYEETDFRQAMDNEYIPVIDSVIQSVLDSDFNSFDLEMPKYSEFQLTRLPHLIPAVMRKYFEIGLESNDFHLKICGSGGGGFFLAIARDGTKAETCFKLNQLNYLIV